jgi:hypothetical protein
LRENSVPRVCVQPARAAEAADWSELGMRGIERVRQ